MDSSTQTGDEKGMTVDQTAQVLMERRAERDNADEGQGKDTSEALAQLEREALGEEEPQELDSSEDETEVTDEQIDADDDADETLSFQYIDEVAEAAGMEVQEFLDAVKARTNVDGELGEVSLAALLKGHQLESSFTRKNQQWIEQQKAEKAELEKQRTELGNHLRNAGLTFQLAQQQLHSDFQSIDWAALEKSDPQKYVLQRQRFGERQAQLNQAIQQATAQAEQAVAAQQRQQEEADQARMERERELMLKAIPEWKDDSQFDADRVKVAQYLNQFGFGEDDMGLLTDHRFILLARAAMTGKRAPQQELRQKLKQAPRLVRSGKQQPRGSSETKLAQELKRKLGKTGKVDDAAELLIARRKARKASQRKRR